MNLRTSMAALAVLCLPAFAQAAPELSASATALSWSGTEGARGINVIRVLDDGRNLYLTTLPGTRTQYTPDEDGRYFLQVVTDDPWQDWPISEVVPWPEGRVDPEPEPDPDAWTVSVNENRLSWSTFSGARAYNIIRLIDGVASYVTTINGSSWTALEHGRYYIEAIIGDDWRDWVRSEIINVSPTEPEPAPGLLALPVLDTCAPHDPTAPWQLVFADEFNGNTLDQTRWTTEYLWGPNLIINAEQQYYVNKGQYGYNPFSFHNGALRISVDRTPRDPDQLYLHKRIFNASGVELKWQAVADAVRYEVWRDGRLLSDDVNLVWTDTALVAGTEYFYEVMAFDEAAQELTRREVYVNTADFYPNTGTRTTFSLQLEKRQYPPGGAELMWEPPSRAQVFEIYQDGELIKRYDNHRARSHYMNDLQADRAYDFTVRALDGCDETVIEESVTIDNRQGTIAEAPLDALKVERFLWSDTQGALQWKAVRGAVRYDVFENDIRIASGSKRSLSVDDLEPGTPRKFTVRAFASNGSLIDEASRVLDTTDTSYAYNRQPYLSGMINSRDSFRFRYGKAEARVRFPKGNGLWGAFWLLNAYYGDDQPSDPEIDVIEALGSHTHVAHQAYHHYEVVDGRQKLVSDKYQVDIDDHSDGFHTYTVVWEPGLLIYSIDGVETARYTGDKVSDEQMYIIANLAVGSGIFSGPVTEDTPFPSAMDIDYIRVWQRR